MPKPLSAYQPGDEVYIRGILGRGSGGNTVLLTEVSGIGGQGRWAVPHTVNLYSASDVEAWQNKSRYWDRLCDMVQRANEQKTPPGGHPGHAKAWRFLRGLGFLLASIVGSKGRTEAFRKLADDLNTGD